MKKLIIILAIVAFIAPVGARAADIPMTFAWIPNTEPDLKQYVIYNRIENQGYNYSIPLKIIAAPTATVDLTLNGVPDNEVTKVYFVIRAEDTNENQSSDSNEVWGSYDLRLPPAPSITAAVYNDTTQTVDFTWTQDDTLVDNWGLFMSHTQGKDYTKIADIIKADPPQTSTSWKIPSDGLYYFVLVAFRNASKTLSADATELTYVGGGFSANSNEVKADVQVHPSPVKTFKIKIKITQ